MPLCHTPYVTAKPAAFNFDNRGFKRHTISVAHRKTKLIRAMLERDCITHAEIAGRIGLTRERVRQLALKMGFADGRSRHAICRVERRRKEMAEFFVAAQQRGFSVEPLGRKKGYINGKICIQRQACWHDMGKGKYIYTFLNIRRPSVKFDICAWKLPDGRFLILPSKLVRFAVGIAAEAYAGHDVVEDQRMAQQITVDGALLDRQTETWRQNIFKLHPEDLGIQFFAWH